MARPSGSFQLFGNHSIHEPMTEQKNRAFAAHGCQVFGSLFGSQLCLLGGLDVP